MAEQFVSNQNTAFLLKWSTAVTLSVAVVLFFAAQYKAWKIENEARSQAEEKLNASADLRGWIQVILPNGPGADPHCILRYLCDCANHGSKECEISRASIEVRPSQGPGFNVLDRFSSEFVRSVAHGEQFRYEGRVHIPLLTCAELRQAEITVVLADSLGIQYRNTTTRMMSG